MRYISLFSGIEAASVAWKDLDGWEPVAFSEIDKFPSAVLAYRFPDVPNLGDITKVDWKGVIEQYGAVDLIVGGSPCQSFSIAGGRESLDGESRLMFEYIRAVQDVRPKWFLWENVPGVLSTRDNAFEQLLTEMEKLGYGMAWGTLDAQFFGVAQRRKRVFLVGYLGNIGCAAAVLFDSESMPRDITSNSKKREDLAASDGYCTSAHCRAIAEWGDLAGNQATGFDSDSRIHEGMNVVCMASGQANAETTQGVSPTLTALHEQPIICMADDNAHAAVNEGVAPTLKVGGGCR